MSKQSNPVVAYYRSLESLLGYRYLKGIKHFGYYPKGQESLSMQEAQLLMNEQLAKSLALLEGSTALDAGCGEGGVALHLAKQHGLQVSGIDLLDFNITHAQQAARKQGLTKSATFQVGTYMELPFKSGAFDAVYTMETLVHAPDYRKALKEFYRVLKPGGKLVLFEYSLKPEELLNEDEKLGMAKIKQVNEVASMPAFNEFTFDNMPKLLAAAGFSSVSVKDISKRILPMLKQFSDKARLPYNIARKLHVENHVINAMSAVVFWDNQNLMRYNIITASK